MTLATTPMCVGINAAAASNLAATNIAGHAMMGIAGGHTVIGSTAFEDATPRWASLSPYLIGETAVSESEYREVMGLPGRDGTPENHPVTMVSHNDALDYIKKRGSGLRLPTEAEWENAARGPAVDIAKLMEAELGRYRASDVADFVDGRFENLVFGVLGHIFTDPKTEIFQKLIGDGRPFFGWRVFGTPSGRLTHNEAWFDKDGTVPVNWGQRNAYGLYNMAGNVWEWMQDWYSENSYMLDGVNPVGPDKGDFRVLRGGSWDSYDPRDLRAANRDDARPGYHGGNHGFRVAAPQDSGK